MVYFDIKNGILKFKKILDTDGQVMTDNSEYIIELSVSKNSGNYLVHKEVLRQIITRKKFISS